MKIINNITSAVIIVSSLLTPFYAADSLASNKNIQDSPLYNPQLSIEYLIDQPVGKSVNALNKTASMSVNSFDEGVSDLVVSTYNIHDGLIAGYQAENSTRLLFKSAYYNEGTLFSRVFYKNPKNGKISSVLTTSPVINSVGDFEIKLLVNGIDIHNLLKEKNKNRSIYHPDERKLKKFLRSDVGIAFIEFVPVLFAKLEEFDEGDNELAGLKVPFGLVRMVIDLITNSNEGFSHADRSLGKKKANYLRSSCDSFSCQFKTKQFTIHNNGMFDVMSMLTQKKVHTNKLQKKNIIDTIVADEVDCKSFPKPEIMSSGFGGSDEEDIKLPDPNKDCHGFCGLGCLTPGDVTTTECRSHDDCVKEHGHIACLYDPPTDDDGVQYSSLGVAAASFFGAILGPNIGSISGNLSGYLLDSRYHFPAVGTFCTFEIFCVDR
ncbi:hypothetical protein AADZ91_06620 [Colwelliaceae bacterium 6441]